MLKALTGLVLVATAMPAWAASQPTDFGVRSVSSEGALMFEPARGAAIGTIGPRVDLRSVASLGSQWGRVTSTIRSREHNRRVGGVRNSFHLTGRAIDIARRPGVSHAQIAAAYRNAGYRLIESLDEGDHSHFAFGSGASQTFRPAPRKMAPSTATPFRVVTVASAILK